MYIPKIGKNILENLTTGMYNDSKIIYREYIQNAADSIEHAVKDGIYESNDIPKIDIDFDIPKRIVTIHDNAYGVKESEITKKLADIADSDKQQGIDIGFRGIGRLGGLGYCDTLRFITSYPGEPIKSIMTWNAKELRRMFNDTNVKDSAEIILDQIISYSEEECSPDEHFFTVKLEDINVENRELMDASKIKQYLSANSPIDFDATFHLKKQIEEFVFENNLKLPVYNVYVQGEDIHKKYNIKLYKKPKSGKALESYDKVESIAFKEFKNQQDELLAWMWYGVSSFAKQIPIIGNPMRGIRFRKHNIQIGDEYTIVNREFFTEPRGNFYFIGEVHVTHQELIPNARRDYFNENNTRLELETELKDFCKDLQDNYRAASTANTYFEKLKDLNKLKEKYTNKEKSGTFYTKKDQEDLLEKIHNSEKDVKEAQILYYKKKEKSEDNPIISNIFKYIESKYSGINSSDINFSENTSINSNSSGITPGDIVSTDKSQSSKDNTSVGKAGKISISKTPSGKIPDRKTPTSKTSTYETPTANNPTVEITIVTTPNVETTDVNNSANNDSQKSSLLTDQLVKLNENERKLIDRVYEVIRKCLPPNQIDNLILKIQDELNKDES